MIHTNQVELGRRNMGPAMAVAAWSLTYMLCGMHCHKVNSPAPLQLHCRGAVIPEGCEVLIHECIHLAHGQLEQSAFRSINSVVVGRCEPRHVGQSFNRIAVCRSSSFQTQYRDYPGRLHPSCTVLPQCSWKKAAAKPSKAKVIFTSPGSFLS